MKDSSQVHKDGSMYTNHSLWYITTKEKTKPYDHPQQMQKKHWQKSTSIHDKKLLTNVHMEGIYLNIITAVYGKTTTNTIALRKNWKPSHWNLEQKQGCRLSPLLFNTVLNNHSNQTRKRIKVYPNRKGRGKVAIICTWLDNYTQKTPKTPHKS